MAGKYGSASISITLEDAPGGTARTISSWVLEMGGVKITSAMEKSDGFGELWDKHTPAGKKSIAPITLSGHWDTTATTGPHAVLKDVDDDPQDDGRELVAVFGDSKTFTADVRLQSYEVLGENGKLTRFSAELLPTGAGVWS